MGNIGRALGRGVGKVAKGVGSVAGGIAGIPSAMAQGFQQGKQAVTGKKSLPKQPNPNSMSSLFQQGRDQASQRIAAKQAAVNQPEPDTDQTAANPKTVTKRYDAFGPVNNPNPAAVSAQKINQQGPQGTAAAKTQTGTAAQALQKTQQVAQQSKNNEIGQSMYAQVKSVINDLDTASKKQMIHLLQKSMSSQSAGRKPSQAEIDADRERLIGPGSESTESLAAKLAEKIQQYHN